MINQVVLVGRLTKDPKITENKKWAFINLAIPRSFKNSEGEYETDFIDVEIGGCAVSGTCEYCRKGDIVGVKGRIENKNNTIVVIGERITYLQSKQNGNEVEN